METVPTEDFSNMAQPPYNENLQKYLDIAKVWYDNQHEQGVNIIIAKALHVNGRKIGKGIKLVRDGTIMFKDGEPYFAKPIVEKPVELADITDKEKTEKTESAALDTVTAEHIRGQTREATLLYDQMVALGRVTYQAVFSFYAKRGYTPQEILAMPLHVLIPLALDKAEKYDQLKEWYTEIRNEVMIYRQELDPHMRLRYVISLVKDILKVARDIEELGGDFFESSLVKYYENLINEYLKGKDLPEIKVFEGTEKWQQQVNNPKLNPNQSQA